MDTLPKVKLLWDILHPSLYVRVSILEFGYEQRQKIVFQEVGIYHYLNLRDTVDVKK